MYVHTNTDGFNGLHLYNNSVVNSLDINILVHTSGENTFKDPVKIYINTDTVLVNTINLYTNLT